MNFPHGHIAIENLQAWVVTILHLWLISSLLKEPYVTESVQSERCTAVTAILCLKSYKIKLTEFQLGVELISGPLLFTICPFINPWVHSSFRQAMTIHHNPNQLINPPINHSNHLFSQSISHHRSISSFNHPVFPNFGFFISSVH